MQRESTTALLAGVIDYAGLFPPAGLSMSAAAAEYHAALTSAGAWMLGRFVTPAARLFELAEARAALPLISPWPISAIVRDGSNDDLAAIAAFNAAAARHLARVDTIEAKPQSLAGVDWLAAPAGDGIEVYVEVAPGPDVDQWLARVAARGLRAKVRTGGLTADAFPAPTALAAFIAAAVRLRVPFKATAGLHHAVRGAYRLTYDDGAQHAPMYGYLNMLLATAAVRDGRPVAVAETILQQTDTSALVFADQAVSWGAEHFPLSSMRDTRQHHLVSFGSCSFREPVAEFDALASR
jgi:hypothetical protein